MASDETSPAEDVETPEVSAYPMPAYLMPDYTPPESYEPKYDRKLAAIICDRVAQREKSHKAPSKKHAIIHTKSDVLTNMDDTNIGYKAPLNEAQSPPDADKVKKEEDWRDCSHPPPSGLPKPRQYNGADSAPSSDWLQSDESDRPLVYSSARRSVCMSDALSATSTQSSTGLEEPRSLVDKQQADNSDRYRLNFRIVEALKLSQRERIARRRKLQRELSALDAAMAMSSRKKRRHMSWYGEPGDVYAVDESDN